MIRAFEIPLKCHIKLTYCICYKDFIYLFSVLAQLMAIVVFAAIDEGYSSPSGSSLPGKNAPRPAFKVPPLGVLIMGILPAWCPSRISSGDNCFCHFPSLFCFESQKKFCRNAKNLICAMHLLSCHTKNIFNGLSFHYFFLFIIFILNSKF